MKINKLIQKYYIDIFFLIILIVIFIGGVMAVDNASADKTNTSVPDAAFDISHLMQSAKMDEAVNPEVSPDFTLLSLDGEEVQLSQKQGKVVMLAFWSTW